MSKSDSLKNGMRSGLDGLLSSTGKSTQKKEPAPVKAEKEPAVHCNFVIDKYNPQIEMFARFKMKSSFHKTKRII